MDDADPPGLGQRVGDLLGDIQDGVEIERPARAIAASVVPSTYSIEMKSSGCPASLGAADFVDHRDVRMVQRRGRARLGEQPRGAVAFGSGWSIFSATMRRRLRSSARYTSPMPPDPKRSRTR